MEIVIRTALHARVLFKLRYCNTVLASLCGRSNNLNRVKMLVLYRNEGMQWPLHHLGDF